MNGRRVHRWLFVSVALATGVSAVAAFSLASLPMAGAATGLRYSVANVGAYGGEPSIVSDSKGVLYDTTPSGLPSGQYQGSPPVYRSTNHGSSWTLVQPADDNSGDDCLATDQARSLYWCNLPTGPNARPRRKPAGWRWPSAARAPRTGQGRTATGSP